jgi:uncharacterized membrane protein
MSGRLSAQARADRIGAFREELAQLERELGGVLDDAQRQRVALHHDALLADLSHQYDVATTESDRQLALGLRFASFLGALALCIAVVLFVHRFWGALGTATQIGLLALGTLLALGLTEFAARREKTLYFAGLAALVAFAAFVTDVTLLGLIYNLIPSPHAFLLWAAFAGALAYGYGLRLLLLAGLVTGSVWLAGTLATLGGYFWTDLFLRAELLLPAAALAVALGMRPHDARREGFAPVYRLTGLILLFWVVLWHAVSGYGSLLPLAPEQVEAVYQVFGFAAAALAIWVGIRRRWRDMTATGVAAFTILLFIKAVDWWWDWMPRWLFFLALGGIAVGVMLLLKRIKARAGGAP